MTGTWEWCLSERDCGGCGKTIARGALFYRFRIAATGNAEFYRCERCRERPKVLPPVILPDIPVIAPTPMEQMLKESTFSKTDLQEMAARDSGDD